MKKRNVLNLIKYHMENNSYAFKTEAIEIARGFDAAGDHQLAEYIMSIVADSNAFVPQSAIDDNRFLQRMPQSQKPLPLPTSISEDIHGIINAVGHNAGINKFLFQGPPGTGKTETTKHLARILERNLYAVDFGAIIDSKLGQTSKNITALFREINGFPNPERVIILFDEIDALALDRTNSRDLREMGRATSTFLREIDNMSAQVLLIATTNLFDKFDKAITRRFDGIIDFSRYTQEDLREIATVLMGAYLDQFKFAGKDTRLFNKILKEARDLPYPADLAHVIKTSIAFSDPGQKYDYLQRIYKAITGSPIPSVKELREKGFTLREIGILTGAAASSLSRELKE